MIQSNILFQIDKEGPESVCVKEILLELRNYRMGLIQTPDQLKFSYLAIVEGAKGLGLVRLIFLVLKFLDYSFCKTIYILSF